MNSFHLFLLALVQSWILMNLRFGVQIGLLWIDWGDTFLVIWINFLIGALFWLIQAHPLFILLVMSCEVQMVWIGWLRMYHLGNLSRLKKKRLKSFYVDFNGILLIGMIISLLIMMLQVQLVDLAQRIFCSILWISPCGILAWGLFSFYSH